MVSRLTPRGPAAASVSIAPLATLKTPFFFQAEDGIRDRDVTGVQTCALPISLLNAPRSDPYERDSRIRLPPRVFDAEAVRRPRMEDLGRRQPFTRETFDPFPCRDVLLAAPPERAPPEVDNIEAERTEHANVGGHGVVVEPALDHLAKPFPLSRQRFMHALSQAFLDLLQLRPHAVASALALQEEAAFARFAADEDEAQELEGLRLAQAASFAVGRCETAELDQTGLVRMERQRKRRQSFTHRIQEAAGVGLRPEAEDRVVGVAYDDHVALGFAPSPALGPQIEDVVQVDVGEQRRDGRSLPRSPLRNLDPSVFENARPKPFLDQAENALVADAMFEGPGEPFFAHRVEELRNVGVDNVIHLPGVDGRRQGVERVVRSPPRPESVTEAEEVFLVDRIQHVGHGALNDLILQRRHRQRPLAAVRFGYVNPPARRRPIRPALDSVMQVRELMLEVCFVVPPRYSVDPGGRVLGYRIERVPQSFRCDVVQERGELLLLVAPCSYPYAIPRL